MLIAALIPLVFDRWYYYMADTSEGAYGLWFHLGQEISQGRWPMLNPSAWMSGNYAAEGQWGLFSPITIGIGLLCFHASNVLLFSTAVKVVFLVVAACGLYCLARSYSIRAPWAFIASTAAPLNGFTMYMDAPSWVTNLIVWSLLPWAWLGVRRYVSGKSPWLALLGAYLIVSVGYVHGVLMLFAVLGGMFLEVLINARWRAWAVVWIGLFSFLVTLTVFLPGFLSVGVTNREASGIGNDGFMVADLTGLASSVIPSALPQISAWWGMFAAGPVLYTAWVLPMLVFASAVDYKQMVRTLTAPLSLLLVTAGFVLGPSYVGPLRFPTRLMPFLVLAVLLVWAYVMSSRPPVPIPISRMWIAQAIIAAGTYLAASQVPASWASQMLFGVLVSVATWVVWARLNRELPAVSHSSVAVLIAAVGLVFLTLQHALYDGTETSSTRRFPAVVSSYQTQLANGRGDAIVVGAVPQTTPDIVPVSLVANQWYLNGNVSAQNLYTTIQFRGYAEQVCMDHRGSTCPELLVRLFSTAPGLTIPLADALAVDTVQVLKTDVPAPLPKQWPPKGWQVVADNDKETVIVRNVETGGAGLPIDVVGAGVTVLDSSDNEVRFRVDSADSTGMVIFSRLAWPGYTVSGGGAVGQPAGGYMLTVAVSPTDVGKDLTLSFRPPGWNVEIASLVLALALGLVLLAQSLRVRRRDSGPALTS